MTRTFQQIDLYHDAKVLCCKIRPPSHVSPNSDPPLGVIREQGDIFGHLVNKFFFLAAELLSKTCDGGLIFCDF